MESLISKHAELFFSHLRRLAAIPTVFSRPEDVKKGMAYCRGVFQRTLPSHTLQSDAGGNLRVVPKQMNKRKPILYLSAHVDTVDADPSMWDAPFSPFVPYETGEAIVGRGVSDCKAGVVFQLFLAELAAKQEIALDNTVFTLSFKEEGAGHKSAVHMGRDLGQTLPVSDVETLLLVLENTVTTGDAPSLGLYTAEKGNFVIELKGSLGELQQSLTRLNGWNPICIYPEQRPATWAETLTQKGGHACSIPREKNRLTEVILAASGQALLSAGDPTSFGVIPTEILKGETQRETAHTLILGRRSFDSLPEILEQLQGITYRELKEFAISPGMDIRDRWQESTLAQTLDTMGPLPLPISLEHNTGISDASTLINTMEPTLTDRVFPVVAGPGTRSQRDTTPQRLTHGKNETFDKKSGLQATASLVLILQALGFVTVPTQGTGSH